MPLPKTMQEIINEFSTDYETYYKNAPVPVYRNIWLDTWKNDLITIKQKYKEWRFIPKEYSSMFDTISTSDSYPNFKAKAILIKQMNTTLLEKFEKFESTGIHIKDIFAAIGEKLADLASTDKKLNAYRTLSKELKKFRTLWNKDDPFSFNTGELNTLKYLSKLNPTLLPNAPINNISELALHIRLNGHLLKEPTPQKSIAEIKGEIQPQIEKLNKQLEALQKDYPSEKKIIIEWMDAIVTLDIYINDSNFDAIDQGTLDPILDSDKDWVTPEIKELAEKITISIESLPRKRFEIPEIMGDEEEESFESLTKIPRTEEKTVDFIEEHQTSLTPDTTSFPNIQSTKDNSESKKNSAP